MVKEALSEPLENLKIILTGTHPRAPDTIANYLSAANQFLVFQGDKLPPAKLDIHRYFARRREQGMNENSLRTHFAILRKLFEANEWPFTLTDRDRPPAPSKTRDRNITQEEVEQLILSRDKYTRGEAFYLAVATTYAPRRIELARLSKKDIKKNTIFLSTAKKGEERTHLIPWPILPYLQAYRPDVRSRSSLSYMFHQICKKGLGKAKPNYGWHSFRYIIDTLLISALSKNDKDITFIGHFLRWSRREFGQRFAGTRMAGVYVRPELLNSDPFYIDQQVFEVHPFLHLWGETPSLTDKKPGEIIVPGADDEPLENN